jgi:Fur family ferric uptake transcriptional regulator
MKRLTPLRQDILEILQEDHVLSANEILVKLGKKYPTVNKTTVYRALDFLIEQDVLCRHSFQTNELSYELKLHHHDHLLCTNCGTVQIAECLVELPKKINGFQVDHHHFTVFGLCKNCQKTLA